MNKLGKDKKLHYCVNSTVISVLIVVLLYVIARNNFPLFHSLTEGFSIVVAALIYVLARQTYQYSQNNFLLFIGMAYFFVGVFDFLHTVTYKGMGVFSLEQSNVATQLWIAGRFVEVMSLAIAPFFVRRAVAINKFLLIYTLVTLGLLASIIYLPIFPTCYLEDGGLTAFKIVAEYVFIAILLFGIWRLRRERGTLDPLIVQIVSLSMVFTAVSEFSFTMYSDVFGVSNFLGHLFKVISYAFIYQGLVVHGLQKPFETIFWELKKSSITDYLTKLYNRQGFTELVREDLRHSAVGGRPIGILMMDLDNFKKVNDRFGHDVGDRMLRTFAGILRETLAGTDLIFRLGGDEFAVVMDADPARLADAAERLKAAVTAWAEREEMARMVSLSIGAASGVVARPEELDELLRKADVKMYREKSRGKSARRGEGRDEEETREMEMLLR